MKRKKKRSKKRPEFPPLAAGEEARLEQLIGDLSCLSPEDLQERITSPAMAVAFLERMPLDFPRAVELIPSIQKAFPQKSVQKILKKTIFKLKQKGITVYIEEEKQGTGLSSLKARRPEPRAWLGAVDGAGNRSVLVAMPRIPAGYHVGMGLVGDEQGISDFIYGECSGKQFREVREIFLRNFDAVIETSLSHAAAVLEKAYDFHGSAPAESVQRYLALRPRILDSAAPLDHAPIYDHILLKNIADDVLTATRMEALFSHKTMASWFLDLETTKALLKEIDEVEKSLILLTEEQTAERIRRLKEKAIAEYFTEERRHLLKYRLEEQAYVLFKMGEESLARTSLVAAASMGKASSLLETNPFLMFILERTLEPIQAFSNEFSSEKDITTGQDRDEPLIILP
ncbi:MAG: hypothetical protein JRF57_03185 [Deltaproteobacteria bacterium]|nr:hypothetical protein [Deltaproteobacteria bacterium]MBW2302697.1 hypothetical protein [Deltaproteobacteria bacterium]